MAGFLPDHIVVEFYEIVGVVEEEIRQLHRVYSTNFANCRFCKSSGQTHLDVLEIRNRFPGIANGMSVASAFHEIIRAVEYLFNLRLHHDDDNNDAISACLPLIGILKRITQNDPWYWNWYRMAEVASELKIICMHGLNQHDEAMKMLATDMQVPHLSRCVVSPQEDPTLLDVMVCPKLRLFAVINAILIRIQALGDLEAAMVQFETFSETIAEESNKSGSRLSRNFYAMETIQQYCVFGLKATTYEAAKERAINILQQYLHMLKTDFRATPFLIYIFRFFKYETAEDRQCPATLKSGFPNIPHTTHINHHNYTQYQRDLLNYFHSIGPGIGRDTFLQWISLNVDGLRPKRKLKSQFEYLNEDTLSVIPEFVMESMDEESSQRKRSKK